jgi:hypothetical protein
MIHKLISAVVALIAILGSAAATPASSTTRPTLPVLIFSDSLITNGAESPAGIPLNGKPLTEGDQHWVAAKTIVRTADGVTVNDPAGLGAGGHHAIPQVAGVIHIEAEVRPHGSGFAGLALGRGNLSGDFWKSYDLLFYINDTSAVLMSGTHIVANAGANKIGGFDPHGFNALQLTVDTVARTVSARVNKYVLVENAELPAGAAPNLLTAAGFRFNEKIIPNSAALRNFRTVVEIKSSSGLTPVNIAQFFVTPDQPATLAWRAAVLGATEQMPFELHDFSGRLIDRGNAQVSSDGQINAAVKLPRGYYELRFPAAAQSFGVVALAAHEGPVDPYFGIDAGLSWVDWMSQDLRQPAVEILKRSGISIARERLGSGAVNRQKDVYDWEGGKRHFESMRNTYTQVGVPILEILSGSPAHFDPIRVGFYPRNLVEASRSWQKITEKFGAGWAGAEVWNEPDLILLPADQYGMLPKTVAYAMGQARATSPVVGGVLATIPPGTYFDTLAANGLFDSIDVLSFHVYDRAPDLQSFVSRYRAWMKASGKESMPLWLTEFGKAWQQGPERPPMDQDALSAMEIAMLTVEGRACGLARVFPFIFHFYEEGPKNFGMMGREFTPLRSMAAYAWCADVLNGATYIGDLITTDPSIKLARVFAKGDGSERVAIVYTGIVKQGASVHLPVHGEKAVGVDGRQLAIDPSGAVPIPDGVTFVYIKADALGDWLKPDTEAARLLAISHQPAAPRSAAPSIVLQYLFEKTPSRVSARGYLLDLDSARKLTISVRIHNLAAQAREVRPVLHLPADAASPNPSHPSRDFPLDAVTVAGLGATDVSWTIDASTALDVAEMRLITITADGEGASRVAPLAIPMMTEGSLETHLARHPMKIPLPVTELKRWDHNVSAAGKMIFSVPPPGLWRMDLTFSQSRGDWAYPKFALPAPIDPQRATGIVLRARILQPGRNVALMLYGEDPRENYVIFDLYPTDGQWHVVYAPFEQFKPGPGHPDMQNARLHVETIRRIAVGLGSSAAANAMEISDMIVVGKDPQ